MLAHQDGRWHPLEPEHHRVVGPRNLWPPTCVCVAEENGHVQPIPRLVSVVENALILLMAVICHWPSGAYPGRRNPAGKAPQGWSAALQARKYEMHEAHQYVQTRANGPYLDNQIGCFHHSSFQQFFVTGGGSDTSSAQAGGRTM